MERIISSNTASFHEDALKTIKIGKYVKLSFNFIFNHPQHLNQVSEFENESILENTFDDNNKFINGAQPLLESIKKSLKSIKKIGDLNFIKNELMTPSHYFCLDKIQKREELIETGEPGRYLTRFSIVGFLYDEKTHCSLEDSEQNIS